MCSPDPESGVSQTSGSLHNPDKQLLQNLEFERIRRLKKLSRNPLYPDRSAIRRIARCILDGEGTEESDNRHPDH